MTRRGAGRDTGESTVAVTEASERAAFLLGWVKLTLTPPPIACSSQAEGPRSLAGGPAGDGNAGGGVDSGATSGTDGGRSRAKEDTQAERINANNRKTRRHTRLGTITNASAQAVTPDAPGARECQAEGGGTAEWSEALPAGPGHVWFHVPSARLVGELPTSWVAFSGVSGGILADVSPHGWG